MLIAREAAAEARRSDEVSPLMGLEDRGVSRTLCQGLARLGGTNHDHPFEIRFTWASAAPTEHPDSSVRFEGEQVVMLDRASSAFGRQLVALEPSALARPTVEQAELQGRVDAMQRDTPTGLGWVTVRGVLLTGGGTAKERARVWVPLEPDDYDRALRAHGQGLNVRVAGTLTRTSRRTELDPSTGFFRVL